MITTNLGYPRIGPERELKRAVEDYWRGKLHRDDLLAKARELRLAAWRRQADAGIELIPSNDFALYDHVLDHLAMFGAIPARFGWRGGEVDVDTTFAMARGTEHAPAMEMTKWFDTNYHYLVRRAATASSRSPPTVRWRRGGRRAKRWAWRPSRSSSAR